MYAEYPKHEINTVREKYPFEEQLICKRCIISSKDKMFTMYCIL